MTEPELPPHVEAEVRRIMRKEGQRRLAAARASGVDGREAKRQITLAWESRMEAQRILDAAARRIL